MSGFENETREPGAAPPPPDPLGPEQGATRRDYVFEVQESVRSIRLDRYLVSKFPNFSRTYIQKLIRDRAVTVNDRSTDKIRHPIDVGDRISLRVPGMASLDLTGEFIPLEIIHEDEALVAINKQAGLVVHPPGRGSNAGTLVSGLVHHFRHNLSGVSGPLRPGIVHRLDKDTSGIMLVAKNDSAHFKLGRQFHDREVKKVYQAVVQGELERDEDIIDLPIARHRRNPERMTIDFKSGKSAQTQYRVIERFEGYTHVELYPRTGRTHQLRVHMMYIGHPIATDFLYGHQRVVFLDEFTDPNGSPGAPDSDHIVIARQALHAFRIAFRHPTSEEPMSLSAPLAPDMVELLDNLRKYKALGATRE